MSSAALRQSISPPISTFEELVAPYGISGFLQLLRERTLTFRPGGVDNLFEGLLDWATLRGLVESGTLPLERLRVTHNERRVPSLLYTQKGKVSPPMLANLLTQGASLIAEPLNAHVPALGALCQDIGKRLGEQVKAAAVVTTGRGGAVGRHFDPFDLVVLQMEGSKRWTIHGSPVVDPVEGMPEQPPPSGEPAFDDVVRPGDFLFVPAGYWHHCENGPGLSLHVGVGIRPPTAWHALETLLPQLLAEPVLRAPLTRLSEAEHAAHEAAVKERLIDIVRDLSLSNLAAQRRRA